MWRLRVLARGPELHAGSRSSPRPAGKAARPALLLSPFLCCADRWSQEDMLTLLECMKNNLPSNDGSKFKTTESHLDWEKVAFKDFSGEMCKMKWMEISNEVSGSCAALGEGSRGRLDSLKSGAPSSRPLVPTPCRRRRRRERFGGAGTGRWRDLWVYAVPSGDLPCPQPVHVCGPSLTPQVRKFRTLTELIMDAEEHVKNPYKGKKLKVPGRNWGRALKGDLPLSRNGGLSPVRHPRPAWLRRQSPRRHLTARNPRGWLPGAPEAAGSGRGPSPGYI